jgi:hypothetical protein
MSWQDETQRQADVVIEETALASNYPKLMYNLFPW